MDGEPPTVADGRIVRVVFLEDRAQVAAIGRLLELSADDTLVAVTAQALDALDEAGMPHRRISDFARPGDLGAIERDVTLATSTLLKEVEAHVINKQPAARFDGPGFLTGQDYNVLVSVVALASRAFLMRETIRALRPTAVAGFTESLDPWFADTGYDEAPWIVLLEEMATAEGFTLERLAAPNPGAGTESRPPPTTPATWLPDSAKRLARRTVNVMWHLASRRWLRNRDPLRVLFVGYPNYDWLPVSRELRGKAACSWLSTELSDVRHDWTASLGSALMPVWGSDSVRYAPKHRDDQRDGPPVADLIRTALLETTVKIDVFGTDILPALIPSIVAIGSASVAIARHADEIGGWALDTARPHAVCFSSITSLPQKRLAHACHSRRIAVVAYQHGGTYATHEWTQHEVADWAHADYFLTYGEGITPPHFPLVPLRSHFVPMGSARIASWHHIRHMRRRGHKLGRRILWIAETATRNTTNYSLVEDTLRYDLERRCLTLLCAGDARVTYRPYAGQAETSGVLRWIERTGIPVQVAETASLRRLIRDADLVISDSASGSAWKEVLALEKPLLLYCDPSTARPNRQFAEDLRNACDWRTNVEDFAAAVGEVAAGTYAIDVPGRDVFLTKYVLHRGNPSRRAVEFLECVCRGGVPFHDWLDEVE
jgi:hypothetical protein